MDRTQSISSQWILELYGFDTPEPSADDFSGSVLSQPGAIIGTLQGSRSVQDDIKNAAKTIFKGIDSAQNLSGGSLRNFGITSISLSRNIDTPNAQLQFSITGPLPKDIYLGVWVIASTVGYSDDVNDQILNRFIGQIYDIYTDYVSDDSGNLITISNIRAREWSFLLTSPIRYDVRSLQAAFNANAQNIAGGIATISNQIKITSGGNQQIGDKTTDIMKKITEATFDPFEIAHVILKIVGMISEADAIESTKDVVIGEFNGFATSPPYVPGSLLARLAITKASNIGDLNLDALNRGLSSDGVPSASKNPFSMGFVKVATGKQLKPVYNDGNWNGIFDRTLTVDDYSQNMIDSYNANPDRPKTNGVGIFTQNINQFSAWQMLMEYCDTELNDIYTDLWFEYKDNDKSNVVARPVVVVRDKPYTLKNMLKQNLSDPIKPDAYKEIDKNWTKYDDLPRISISPESIISARFGLSSLNSPNYIKVHYNNPAIKAGVADAQAAISGTIKLKPEMNRFGGNYGEITTLFLGLDTSKGNSVSSSIPGSDKISDAVSKVSSFVGSANTTNAPGNQSFFVKWFSTISELARQWGSYNYRMPDLTLTIKDNNYALSVGFNLQFQIGNFTLVGNIRSVNTSFSVSSTGNRETVTTIYLKRVVMVLEDNSLSFIPMDAIGRMFTDIPNTKNPTGIFSAISDEAQDLINNFNNFSLS